MMPIYQNPSLRQCRSCNLNFKPVAGNQVYCGETCRNRDVMASRSRDRGALASPDWTPAEMDRLTHYWQRSMLTAHQIAEHFPGRSRNAIIGKAHRLSLERPQTAQDCDPEITARHTEPPEIAPERPETTPERHPDLCRAEMSCRNTRAKPYHFCREHSPAMMRRAEVEASA